MLTALLDGDIVAYRAAAASEKDIDWGDGGEGATVSPDQAAERALYLANDWTKKAGAKQTIVCFSPIDGNIFRKHILPTYKAGRPPKPDSYTAAMETLENEFKVTRMEGLEADDVLGVVATSGKLETVIVSIDKDLQCVPGRILNPVKDKRPRVIRPHQADFYWMYQTLTGDITDNYKGCPGIGKVKALKALTEAGPTLPAMWNAVEQLFSSKKLTLEDAVLQARVARILRHPDYDNQNRRIKLWHPIAKQTAYLQLPLKALPTPTTPGGEGSSPSSSSKATASTSARVASSSTSTGRRSRAHA